MGYNYVLGTREEENCFIPIKVHPKMFYEAKVRTVGCGTQHLSVLCAASSECDDEPKFDFTLPMPVSEMAEEEEDEGVEESKEPEVPAVIE